MITNILRYLSNLEFCKRSKISKLYEEIPNQFLELKYNSNRKSLSCATLILSFLISVILSLAFLIYDFLFGLMIFIILFLLVMLLLLRKIKKEYLKLIMEVEQISTLICNEISLVLSTTQSLPLSIEYLAAGDYPILTDLFHEMITKINLGINQIELLKNFAEKQPSETIKEYFLDYVIPLVLGEISIQENIHFDSQWRIRNKFEAYSSQIEGKMSLFLSITTIIPLTISILLVMLGYINVNILIFLPLLFFIFDLIALEFFNSGKVELLGGK